MQILLKFIWVILKLVSEIFGIKNIVKKLLWLISIPQTL